VVITAIAAHAHARRDRDDRVPPLARESALPTPIVIVVPRGRGRTLDEKLETPASTVNATSASATTWSAAIFAARRSRDATTARARRVDART
jgi:hypothetical protein